MLEFKIFEKFDEECSKSFESLTHKANYSFFQTYSYLKSLSSISKSEIKVVAIYENRKIIAILPLEIKKYFIFRVLQWIGTQRSDFCNPILIENFDKYIQNKNFLSLWKNILKDIGVFDLIFFNNQISMIGDSTNPFTTFLKSAEFSKIYQIRLPDLFQKYLDNQKKKDKKKYYEIHRITIKLKKLEEKLNVLFDIKELTDENDSIKDIIKNKVKQLDRKKIRHNLDQKFIKIFENIINKDNSRYFIANLKVENKIIASCFGILLNDTFYYYIPFMMPNDYNNFKPGKILVLKIINWCIENKIKIFDFGLGEEKYKRNFSNHSLSLHRFIEYKSLLGKFLFLGMKIIFFNKKI